MGPCQAPHRAGWSGHRRSPAQPEGPRRWV